MTPLPLGSSVSLSFATASPYVSIGSGDTPQSKPSVNERGSFEQVLGSVSVGGRSISNQVKTKSSVLKDADNADKTRTAPDESQAAVVRDSIFSRLGLDHSLSSSESPASVDHEPDNASGNQTNAGPVSVACTGSSIQDRITDGSAGLNLVGITGKFMTASNGPSNDSMGESKGNAAIPSEGPPSDGSPEVRELQSVTGRVSASLPDGQSKTLVKTSHAKPDLEHARDDQKAPGKGVDISLLTPVQPVALASMQPLQAPDSIANESGDEEKMKLPDSPSAFASLRSSEPTLTEPATDLMNATAGKLAFALRLTREVDGSQSEASSSEDPLTQADARLSSAQSGTAIELQPAMLSKEFGHHQDNQDENPQGYAPVASPETSQADQHKFEVTKASTADPDTEKPFTQEPLRNVHVQLTGDANQRVDLRLSDRGGQLHVSVRSGDLNLAQSLQERIPDLTSKLQQHRFGTEVYIPRASESSSGKEANTHNSSSTNDSEIDSNSSNRQRKRHSQEAPDWVDEFDSLTSKSSLRIKPTWLQ